MIDFILGLALRIGIIVYLCIIYWFIVNETLDDISRYIMNRR